MLRLSPTYEQVMTENENMTNAEELLRKLNLSLAHFGGSEAASSRSLLTYPIPSSDAHRLYLQIAAKLGFKIE